MCKHEHDLMKKLHDSYEHKHAEEIKQATEQVKETYFHHLHDEEPTLKRNRT